ncbi:unnamed protein product [Eruca vesicaria subsp. sativa]|uniref:Uncharacterized protein n=1 Tax=Eruca vesicaria subsp. sativa TaxID=29727 RepID=A0ABC8KB04_ERUVS|nr:unnamed protein product [Eruca vesicaria subsp. sativa]
MGTGEKNLKGFHLLRKQTVKNKDVPKGFLAIKVGSQGEEQQRFVVPVLYFNHPLFMQLLKEAEDEYGFDQKGTITIPCEVAEFLYVQDLIDGERSVNPNHHQRHSGRDQYHHLVGCFRA